MFLASSSISLTTSRACIWSVSSALTGQTLAASSSSSRFLSIISSTSGVGGLRMVVPVISIVANFASSVTSMLRLIITSFSSKWSIFTCCSSTSMLLLRLAVLVESRLRLSFSLSSILSTSCSTLLSTTSSTTGLSGPNLGLGRLISPSCLFGFSGVAEEVTEIPLELYMSSKNCARAFFWCSFATAGVSSILGSTVPFVLASLSLLVSVSAFFSGLLSFTRPFFLAQFLQELVKLVLRRRLRGRDSVLDTSTSWKDHAVMLGCNLFLELFYLKSRFLCCLKCEAFNVLPEGNLPESSKITKGL